MAIRSAELAAVLAHIDRTRLEELVVEAVECYSPSFSEGPATDVFAGALDSARVPYHRQSVPGPWDDEDRANLVVELGPDPPALLWLGHVDTVPLQRYESVAVRRDGDLLWGLGAADMKGGCAAILEALAAVRASGVRLRRGLRVGLVVGEEEYGDGAQALLSTVSAPLAIIGEPTGLVACTSHYGYLEHRLECRGARAHAALPEVGASAIHAMLAWMLRSLDAAAAGGDELAVNPRQIQGGDGQFVVADRCEAMLDVHVRPGRGPDAVAELIASARDAVQADHPGCTMDSEAVYWAPGYEIERDDQRLAPLRRAFAQAGLPWDPSPFRSHSDAAQLFQRGVCPVVCGPGKLEVAHVSGEHVSMDEVLNAARLYAAMIVECCVLEG
ncbi:MAG: peptidase M20 [Myxococcales bacterium]